MDAQRSGAVDRPDGCGYPGAGGLPRVRSHESTPLTPMQRPLRQPIPTAVQRLMLGEFLGLLATASMQLSVAWWIGRDAGAGDLARYAALMGAAALIITPLLSPAGDRWPKRTVIRLGRLMLVVDASAV